MSFFDEVVDNFRRPNNYLTQIIIINIAVFVVLNIIRVFSPSFGGLLISFFAIPSEISSFITRPWTILTYGFTQVGIGHIFWNMIGLYWFGRIIEDFIGSNKVLGIYILGVLAGALAYLLIVNTIPAFSGAGGIMIGASAGVFAIAVSAAVLVPDYTLSLLFIGPVKIKYIVAVFVFLSFIGVRGSNAGGEIAHLGGALMGFLYIQQLRKGNDWSKPVIAVADWFRNIFKPRPKVKVSYRGPKKQNYSASGTSMDQDEIDAILDKISQSGYESLTKEEKQKLFQASNKNN